jgi:fused signal recognition particle receptor
MVFGGLFNKLKDGLAKTRNVFTQKVKELFTGRKIDETLLAELEELLITSDIGVEMSQRIIESLKQAYKEGKLTESGQIYDYLKTELKHNLVTQDNQLITASAGPTVILVTGVNGTGKTTSIAKLAFWLRQKNKSVLLAASDTFRAAATEQLTIWSERLGVDIVKHQSGADPGAVAFDAAEAALARKIDYLIVDTAGRLHTKDPLMKELTKISNVIAKKIPGAPHEVLLVLDATTGQNAIIQAKSFNEAVKITGIVLAKLDGTAKGGIILAIKNQLKIPVKFIGLGEQPDDIEAFDADKFVDALFE